MNKFIDKKSITVKAPKYNFRAVLLETGVSIPIRIRVSIDFMNKFI